MTHETEAHRAWRVEPCEFNTAWFTVGYPYEGKYWKAKGQFVPVHHWGDRASAEAMAGALLNGASREEAKQAGMAA